MMESTKSSGSAQWSDGDLEPRDPARVAVDLGIPEVRIDVIRTLARSGPSTVSELAVALGRARNGVIDHLNVLESLGAIESEVARRDGIFRPTRVYRLASDGVEALAWSVFDALAAQA